MNELDSDKMDAWLARVPRAIEPPHDLWPAIAEAVSASPAGSARRRRFTTHPWALAASVVTLIAATITWHYSRHEAAPPPALSAQTSPVDSDNVAAARFEPPRSTHYVAARAALESVFVERLALLAPATRARVQADLAIIRKANADIRAALAQDPASPLLQQLLRSTWQQEIDLYANVTRSTDYLYARRTRS